MIKRSKIGIILSLLNVITSFLTIALAFITKTVIDNACNDKPVMKFITILIIFVLLDIVIRIVYQILKNKEYLRLEISLKEEVFNSILLKTIPDFKDLHTGELSNLYLVDIRNVASGKTETIPDIFASVSSIIFSFIALAIFEWIFLATLIGFGLILYLVSRLFYSKIKNLQRESLELDGQMNAFMQETVENIKVVKALNATNSAKIKLTKKADKTKKIKTKKNHIMEIAENGLRVAMNLSYLAAILFSIYKIMNDKMSYGEFFVFVELVMVFERPIMSLAGFLNRINLYKTSVNRVNNILTLEEEDTTEIISDFDEIIFDDVSFSYDKEIISHFSQVFKKNELILFKGPSGAGKTTLFYLLLGFLKPTSGKIWIKFKDDLYEASSRTRSLFSYVSQSNILFSGSLFENIRFFNPDVSDEEILYVLEKVNLKKELLERESNIDIHLNEHGEGLSVGQIQRVLIAISLLQDKPILLLDEFSSALDEKNELDIVDLLIKLNKTIIFISHRNLEIKDIRRINV